MRSVRAPNGFNSQIGGVDNVNASRLLLGRRSAGLLRIPHVFAGSQCLQGLECGSSPTSGTTSSLVRGDFALTCVQSLWSRRLTGWFAGWLLAAAEPMRVCGGTGSRPWLMGLPPAASFGYAGSSFRFCRVGPGWPTPLHGAGLRVRHDVAALTGRPSWQAAFGRLIGSKYRVCPAKKGADTVNTQVICIRLPVATSFWVWRMPRSAMVSVCARPERGRGGLRACC